jgi:uracil-DNA glycosylase
LILWNIVPWLPGDDGKVHAPNAADFESAGPFLLKLLDCLPKLKAVVLVGKKAEKGWAKMKPKTAVHVFTSLHPSPRVIYTDKLAWGKIAEAWKATGEFALGPPAGPAKTG